MHLYLDNSVLVSRVFNLRCHLSSFSVHASLKQRLSVVELILCHVGIELGELVVVFGGFSVVLDVEVAVSEERKSSATAWRKLQFVVKDCDDLESIDSLPRGTSGL